MRLLHTKKLCFEEFFDSKIPKYAILSHRWEETEVSFEDFEKGKKKNGAGYRKILNCCILAKSNEYEWVWIDTCCIDKKSSAELSEAINSMFRWYENAEICYAYLSDVRQKSVGGDRIVEGFEGSKWFTRGWTLQELLAPKQVLFLDSKWETIGLKYLASGMGCREDLSACLSQITGIPLKILRRDAGLRTSSVAQRMSWAAKRQTSRTEDMAYCLLGIFDVSMPLLYGEGRKAFIRLQQEIIKKSGDESIFAWSVITKPQFHRDSLFASWPSCFEWSGDVERRFYSSWIEQSAYVLTDHGLQMDVRLIHLSDKVGETWLLPLNCETQGQRNSVVLRRLHGSYFEKVPDTRTMGNVYGAGCLREWEAFQTKRKPPGCTVAQHSGNVTHTPFAQENRRCPDEEAFTPLLNKLGRMMYDDEANLASDLGPVRRIYIIADGYGLPPDTRRLEA